MDVREKTSNEKRLIDANDLMSCMDECSKESRFRLYYGYAKSFIDAAPTVDAVPVSELEKLRDYLYAEDLIFMRGLAKLNNLIANCGTKMDEVSE